MQLTDWLIPLATLTGMEIILGIDNIIFLAIVVARLPAEQRNRAQKLGMGLALGTRLLLLLVLSWIMGLSAPLFTFAKLGMPGEWAERGISGRDLILLAGGLFLIWKSTHEIHDKLEGADEKPVMRVSSRFAWTLVQIAILDIVFSLDSVITAVGMAKDLWVMAVAMIIAVVVMLFFAGAVSRFVHRHPTLKILALSFLVLIGVMLIAEGLGTHIERGYIYFAMSFAVIVEILNIRLRAKASPVELHEPPPPAERAGKA